MRGDQIAPDSLKIQQQIGQPAEPKLNSTVYFEMWSWKCWSWVQIG